MTPSPLSYVHPQAHGPWQTYLSQVDRVLPYLGHLARWAENHYHYVGPFADYLACIYSRMPDTYTEAKDFLLQNMYEEELADIRHTDLLIRFAEACGTTRERVQDPRNMNPVTRGLQGWCYATAMRGNWVAATAGMQMAMNSAMRVPE